MSLEAGVVRGWDDALEDDNGNPSYVGRFRCDATRTGVRCTVAATGKSAGPDPWARP